MNPRTASPPAKRPCATLASACWEAAGSSDRQARGSGRMSQNPKTFSRQKWLRAYLWRAATVLTIWAVLFAVLAGKEKEKDRRIAGLITAIGDQQAVIRDI